jgi:hypothetical protein
MAKTNNPNIFLVKPTWVKRVLNKPSVWYLKSLTPQQRASLTYEGSIVTHTTQAGRTFTVAAVNDVSDGKTYDIGGTVVSVVKDLNSPVSTQVAEQRVSKDAINKAIYDEAHAAGMAAGNRCTPTPMVVSEHANPWDDSSPVVKQYAPVMGGVCGFAWVNVRPGTCSFARWAKKQDLGYTDSYYGGYTIYVHGTEFPGFEQSMEIKEAYAGAFAAVLRKHGIQASARSRMD